VSKKRLKRRTKCIQKIEGETLSASAAYQGGALSVEVYLPDELTEDEREFLEEVLYGSELTMTVE
jgi:hypothetical protein